MKKIRLSFFFVAIFAILVLPAQAQTTTGEAGEIAEDIRVQSAELRTIMDAADALDRIKTEALEVRNQADHLDSYANSGHQFSWQSHAARLTRIKEDVNDMALDLETLQDIEPDLLPRQKLSLYYILPDALALSSCAERAIDYMNENSNHLWKDPYKEAVSAMYSRADRIVSAAKLAESLLDAGMYLDRLALE